MSVEMNERVVAALLKTEAMAADMAEMRADMRRMAEAVTKLAVVEERQSRDRADIARAFGLIDGHETRIGTLESAQPLVKRTTKLVDSVVAHVLTAVVTAVLATVIVKGGIDPHRVETPVVSPAK